MKRLKEVLLSIFVGSLWVVTAAQAQSAQPNLSVTEFHYTQSSASALDLRPGPYLLELRRQSDGSHLGRLRGPRNEWVAESLQFVGSVCPGSTLSIAPLAGVPSSNGVRLVLNAGNACRAEAMLPILGLTSINVTHGEPQCDPIEEVAGLFSSNDGPACSVEEEPELPIAIAKPDLKPGPRITIGSRTFLWPDRVVLDASRAVAKVNGRCIFDYGYEIENRGRVTSTPTDASLLLDQRLGLQLDRRALASISPGAIQRVSGQFALPTGRWLILAHADADDRVGEWAGRNNVRALRIQVTGDCG